MLVSNIFLDSEILYWHGSTTLNTKMQESISLTKIQHNPCQTFQKKVPEKHLSQSSSFPNSSVQSARVKLDRPTLAHWGPSCEKVTLSF